jgi:phosphonate transport system substrate-binding protein
MPDATSDADAPARRRLLTGRSSVIARILLFVSLIIVLGDAAVALVKTIQERNSLQAVQAQAVANSGLSAAAHKMLAAKFTDAQGRLLADPPASPDQLLNPDTIVVAHIDGVDETPGTSWADWENRLAQLTGKKVEDQLYNNKATQIAAAASGKVTLLALHAADTPFLVNNYGFEPFAVLGDQAGVHGNRLDLIVPAGSSITTAADIKGHKLVCTVPSSITGYRAAVAYLFRDLGLRPNVDYEVIWSLKPKASITGITGTADKKPEKGYDVAAVSDEKLQSLLDKGTIEASQFKMIYQSPVIPRTTIGYFYNLNPTLAAQIRKAILPAGDSAVATAAAGAAPATAPATDASTGLRFLPIDYSADFRFVRTIDDQFDPRFDAQSIVHGGE